MKLSTLPQIYRHVSRWTEIFSILSKYGLADWLSRFEHDFGKRLLKARDGEVLANLSRATRIRLALTELGPTFIKLGQVLSTRADLVGGELATELQRLLDDVPPDPPQAVRQLIESELGQSIESLFSEFDPHPVASASIGQVHRARLRDGQVVAVKVQHVDIQQRVRADLEILGALADLAAGLPEFAHLRPQATVAEFQRALRREMDFDRELRHIERFRRNYANWAGVCIPRPYAELSTQRVLTLQWLEGVRFSQPARLAESGVDCAKIARHGAELYLDMIFRHGFYHADPHPGNILLLPGDVIGVLDFGMIGNIEEPLRERIEEMLLAVMRQDSAQLVHALLNIGSPPPDLDEAALRSELADFVSHYGNQPLKHFDLSGAINELTELIRRHRLRLPSAAALLLKTLVLLEGTGRLIQPEFSLLEVLQPYQKQILRRRFSPSRKLARLRRVAGDMQELAEILPRRMIEILSQIQSGRFDVHLDHRGLEPSVNRLVLGMLTSALFLGSAMMLSAKVWPVIQGRVSLLGALGCLLSFVLGLRLLRAINQSGHLDRRDE